MPSICMVNTVARGSHGRIMADLADVAMQDGFSVRCAYGRGDAPAGDAYRIGNRADVLSHVAITRLFDAHGRGSLRATRRFVDMLKQMQPDILHLHNVHGYYLHLETLFSYIRSARIKTLWTLHDCWPITGHCSHFLHADCMRWRTQCHDCPLIREYPASLGMDASRRNYAWKKAAFSGLDHVTLVSPSKWLDGVLGNSYLSDMRRVVIENGVDISLFAHADGQGVKAAYGVRPGQSMLLCVASPFDARKGFFDAIEIAKQVGDRARLVMVGLDKRQMKALPSYVTGVARVDGPEALVSLYAAADCFLNPSREETYPTVNMEAMAAGTPVAAYAVGGCTEQLCAPVGVAVPKADIRALGEAALSLAAQKKALSDRCRAYARAHFDRAHALDTYRVQYQDLMGG